MAEFPPTRASLLVRLRDPRDEESWRQFVELYAPLVYGYARKQGLQDADAADLTQDVLGAVARAVGRLEYDPQRGAFRNWLFTVVRRKLSDWRSAQAHRPRGKGDTETRQLLEQVAAAPALEAEWEADWQHQRFAWACAQVRKEVTAATWQAFWKTAIEDQSGKEVAARLHVSVAAVYQARSRVVGRLKELIRSIQE